jgi:hypothetical protein
MNSPSKLFVALSLALLVSDLSRSNVVSQANTPDSGSKTAAGAARAPAVRLSFEADEPGAPAKGVEAVIGDWLVDQRHGAKGLLVDGSRWRNGVPSANLADQARRLYGERYAEFLDGVKAFAFFPLTVVEQAPPTGDVRMSVRFYPIAGKIDQAAGIAFGIQPDGSYVGVRANALEDNILWFKVVRGKRSILDTVRNTPTPSKTWHTLVVTLRGKRMEVVLDGKSYLQKELPEAPRGKVGLWSKADSQVLFDDFVVEAL